MALDFPSSPALNDTYTEAGKTWRWNGTGWQLVTTGTVTNADISATAEIAVSKLADGGARQLLQTDAAGTGVEWTSNVDIPGTLDVTGATTLDSTLTVASNVTLNAQSYLRFADADSSNWVAFQGPATVSSNVTWTLPAADGTANQVLSTNGTGTLSWATGGGGGTAIEVGNTKAEVTDTGSNGTFTVTTEGTGRLSVDSSGRTLLGGVTANANGGVLQLSSGITFPATAVDATDANTLDDYEEGTHTATLTPSTSGSITLSADYQTLTYTKIGRLVSLSGFLLASSSSSPVGYVTVSLPFTPAAGSYAGGSVFVDAATGVNMNEFVLIIFGSTARIYLGDGAGFQSDSAQAIASAGQVYLEMNYRV